MDPRTLITDIDAQIQRVQRALEALEAQPLPHAPEQKNKKKGGLKGSIRRIFEKSPKKMDRSAMKRMRLAEQQRLERQEVLRPETAYAEGDLFYGLARPREAFMQKTVPDLDDRLHRFEDQKLVGGTRAAVIVDTLNNQFLGTGANMENPDLDLSGNVDVRQKNREENSYSGPRDDITPDALAFQMFLEGHERYEPGRVASDKEWNLRIGRACKAGLEFTTRSGRVIHFVLDGIDFSYLWEDLLKSKEERGITSKELKWLFRHWEDPGVMDGVVFWREDTVVSPPWVEDPEPWQAYQAYRRKKHKEKGTE